MADGDAPIFGEPGSPLHEAWLDYLMAWDPQERLRAHVRLVTMQELAKPRPLVRIVSC